jgi:hypothetical protein
VVVETIYRAYGSKGKLFKAVVGPPWPAAPTAQVTVEQRQVIAAVIAEPDPAASPSCMPPPIGIHTRAGSLLRVLMGGGRGDPELAQVRAQLRDQIPPDPDRVLAVSRYARSPAPR